MNAVILAGGEGTRLRPLTYHTPKSLLPICNRPFLEHQLLLMQRHGITTATLLTGYLAEQFEPFVAAMAARGIELRVSREEEPLGTAGAVRSISDQLDSTTVVFNGDVLTDLDLTAMLSAHRDRGASLSIALKPVSDAGPYGLVPTDGSGRVQEFLEKPPPVIAAAGGNINAGTYVLDPRVLDEIPPGVMWSFERQLFPSLVAAGAPVYGFVSDGYWLDIGTPERYLRAHWDLLAGASTVFAPAEPRIADGVFVDASASVPPETLSGPCVLVGANCFVEAGAVIGPNACLGSGVRVTAGATVRDSVLMDGVVVERDAIVQGAIVGPETVIGPKKALTGGVIAAGEPV